MNEINAANLPEISPGSLDISQADQELQQKVADFIEKVTQSGGSLEVGLQPMQYWDICIGIPIVSICFPIGM